MVPPSALCSVIPFSRTVFNTISTFQFRVRGTSIEVANHSDHLYPKIERLWLCLEDLRTQ